MHGLALLRLAVAGVLRSLVVVESRQQMGAEASRGALMPGLLREKLHASGTLTTLVLRPLQLVLCCMPHLLRPLRGRGMIEGFLCANCMYCKAQGPCRSHSWGPTNDLAGTPGGWILILRLVLGQVHTAERLAETLCCILWPMPSQFSSDRIPLEQLSWSESMRCADSHPSFQTS